MGFFGNFRFMEFEHFSETPPAEIVARWKSQRMRIPITGKGAEYMSSTGITEEQWHDVISNSISIHVVNNWCLLYLADKLSGINVSTETLEKTQ